MKEIFSDFSSVRSSSSIWGGIIWLKMSLCSHRRVCGAGWSCREEVLEAAVLTPPARSQSTVGQSSESWRIRPLLRCCNCTRDKRSNGKRVSKGERSDTNYWLEVWVSIPLAIRVELNAVDGSKVTFDSTKFLFVGSVEKPTRGQSGIVWLQQ